LLGGALTVLLTAAPPPRPRIGILVYNYAAVSIETMASAKREADLIYGRMGVEIEWADYPMLPHEGAQAIRIPPGPDRLEVRMLPRSMADRLKIGRDEIGRAMIAGEDIFGTIADIFTDRIMDMTSTREWAAGPLVGDVMAHEIGHLLLGPRSHSNGGIMRTQWGEKDLHKALQRQMIFTPREGEQIKKQVLARMLKP
jgi:hypothetical protein